MKIASRHLTTSFLVLVCAVVWAQSQGLRGDPEKAKQGWELIEQGALVIDVRTTEEYEAGHLEGALHIPWEQTDELMAAIGEDKQRKVVMYCGSGGRVGRAIEALEAEGYEGLFNATGYDALEATKP